MKSRPRVDCLTNMKASCSTCRRELCRGVGQGANIKKIKHSNKKFLCLVVQGRQWISKGNVRINFAACFKMKEATALYNMAVSHRSDFPSRHL